jgi:outer membrane protein OmpA-like peptidoglycan-associated protein
MRTGEKMINIKYAGIIIIIIVLSVLIYGCGTSNAVKGGVIGGVSGGVVGGVIGDQYDNTVLGAIIGAAIGGTAGVLIGNYMDKQADEMDRDIEGAKTERIGEGIKITFDSGILFTVNSSTLESTAKTSIAKLGVILNKYPDTNILVTGHTDSDGTEQYNQSLSEGRAKSVSNYIMSRGINSQRLSVIGLGEGEPAVSNETTEGKRLNRRVEIAIFANEALKDAAERGDLN